MTNELKIVSFETAKLLKESGFDVDYYHPKPSDIYNGCGSSCIPTGIIVPAVVRTPQALAQMWLRDVHKINLYVFPTNVSRSKTQLFYRWHIHNVFFYLPQDNENKYDTYEEALESGIQKACEYLIQKQIQIKK